MIIVLGVLLMAVLLSFGCVGRAFGRGGLPFFGKRELFRLRERKESGLILITEYNLYGVLFGVYETIME